MRVREIGEKNWVLDFWSEVSPPVKARACVMRRESERVWGASPDRDSRGRESRQRLSL